MTSSRIGKLDDLLRTEGPILRSASLRSARFCSKDVAELMRKGYLRKIRRGYYTSALAADRMNALEILASLAPDGVVSLYSAAHFHNLTTVIPHRIEITLPASRRTPVFPETLMVKVYKSDSHIYKTGIEIVTMEGFPIKMYNRERTVCDCIRMRLKLGKDSAIEVLKNYMAGHKNLHKLYEYAEILKIESVIHPYLEVLA